MKYNKIHLTGASFKEVETTASECFLFIDELDYSFRLFLIYWWIRQQHQSVSYFIDELDYGVSVSYFIDELDYSFRVHIILLMNCILWP